MHKLPFDNDIQLRDAVACESLGYVPTLHESLADLIKHTDYHDETIELVLDWAYQISKRMELPLDESLALAMRFYFG